MNPYFSQPFSVRPARAGFIYLYPAPVRFACNGFGRRRPPGNALTCGNGL